MKVIFPVLFILILLGFSFVILKSILKGLFSSFSNSVKTESKNKFNFFVDYYIDSKKTSSENIKILQLISRDLMKSHEYRGHETSHNITTFILTTLMFLGGYGLYYLIFDPKNQALFVFVGMAYAAVCLWLLFRRKKYKQMNIFEKVPLSEKHAEKLKSLNVQGAVKDYIDEKTQNKHALNGGDILFLTTMF